MQRIGGCAFLSVFPCWLIVTADQSLAADSRSGVVATATQRLVLTGAGL